MGDNIFFLSILGSQNSVFITKMSQLLGWKGRGWGFAPRTHITHTISVSVRLDLEHS